MNATITETLVATLRAIASAEPIAINDLARVLDLEGSTARVRVQALTDRGLALSTATTSGWTRRGGKNGLVSTERGRALLASVDAGAVTPIVGPATAASPGRAVRRYLARARAGWTDVQIARHYGVSRQAVSDAIRRWAPRQDAIEAATVRRRKATDQRRRETYHSRTAPAPK